MESIESEPVHILLVDDDDVDAENVIRGFRKLKIANAITVAENGEEALRILRGNGHKPLPKPFVVLLDLNMPRMNGFEFLEELRADVKIRDSIVFVLTTSSAETDKAKSYLKNVAGYLVKSQAGPDFKHAVTLLDKYWTTVSLPK